MHDLLDVLAYRYGVSGLAADCTTIAWAAGYLAGIKGRVYALDALAKLNEARVRRGKMPARGSDVVTIHGIDIETPQDAIR